MPVSFSLESDPQTLTLRIGALVLRGGWPVVNGYIWNLCDFNTDQVQLDIGSLNLKTIFARDHRYRGAAHHVKEK